MEEVCQYLFTVGRCVIWLTMAIDVAIATKAQQTQVWCKSNTTPGCAELWCMHLSTETHTRMFLACLIRNHTSVYYHQIYAKFEEKCNGMNE